MNRRTLLTRLAAGVASAALSANLQGSNAMSSRLPVLFLAHGAPPLLDEPGWMAELAAWAAEIPRPTTILMVSAHWESRPAAIGATRPLPLIYDFGGFPDRFYRLQYPSPGAPTVAERLQALLSGAGIPVVRDESRGLDHGAYIPLMAMYPKADVPVLQMSLPTLDPVALHRFGIALAPLRDEGVLIVGSGFLTHNLRAFSQTTPAWAAEFDTWAADRIRAADVDALADFVNKGPGARIAHPRAEHYVPLLVAAGAARDSLGEVRFPIEGFWYGAFTRRSVQWG